MEREVLAVLKRVLGADTLHAAGNLADYLSRQGKYDEAEKMQREVLAVQKRVLGASRHADYLADSLTGQGKDAEAEKPQKKSRI